jgi:general secretion pathway protein G
MRGKKVTNAANLFGTRSTGFGLLDLMVTVVLASLLISIAVPSYDRYVQRAKVTAARGAIASLSLELEKFRLNNEDALPATLDELPVDIPLDPWGRPYAYLNILTAGTGKGALRKDGKLNPLNTDFDLYSLGRDGVSTGPLNAKASRDDIVRANNGAFIGLAEDY